MKEQATLKSRPEHPGEKPRPIHHVLAKEAALSSPESGTEPLFGALVDDHVDHAESKAAGERRAMRSRAAQNELQTPEGSFNSRELAPRASEPLQRSDDSDEDSIDRALAMGHADALAEVAYVHLASKICPPQEQLLEAAVCATLSFQQQMRPRDALERLAHAQIVMAHARVAWLTKLATNQTDVPSLVSINEACDRASGTFVRLMRAIGEYRQPPSPSTTVSIGQANLAQQQLVQNIQKRPRRNNVDEQTRIRGGTGAGAALSAIREGIAVAQEHHFANSAVDEEHRPTKSRRKVANPNERSKTRRTVSRQRRIPQTGKGNT